ncbi:hypothetical protein SSU05_1234 [Streptococcus suis 05ZYH33]|nr:hypothetical protein SSU05_1234 [Streptococcus suis 05ZYH33]
MEVVLIFFVIFLKKILGFKILFLLGFEKSLNERNYLFPPLLGKMVTGLVFYQMEF